MLRQLLLFSTFFMYLALSSSAQVYRETFTEDPSLRANPERGFSRWTGSESDDLYPFEASWLDPLREDLKQTVINNQK